MGKATQVARLQPDKFSVGTEVALKTAGACVEGGIKAIEITFTVPGAVRVIESLASRFDGGDVLIGAGTVLDPKTARAAILAGAQVIAGPSLNAGAAHVCNRYQHQFIHFRMGSEMDHDIRLLPSNGAGDA